MRINQMFALVLALSVGFGTACQPGPQMPIVSAPGDPTGSSQTLMANDWKVQVIVSLEGDTQVSADWPESAGQLVFRETGLAGGDMGCNTFVADWTSPATEQIRIGWDQLATAKYCGENTDWWAFPSTLETVTSWEITDDGQLRLFGDQTLLEAVPAS